MDIWAETRRGWKCGIESNTIVNLEKVPLYRGLVVIEFSKMLCFINDKNNVVIYKWPKSA